MERRALVVGFAALVSATWTGEAQPAQIPLVGALWPLPQEAPGVPRLLEAFRQGLREVGYVEGKGINLEHRWAANYEASLALPRSSLIRKHDRRGRYTRSPCRKTGDLLDTDNRDCRRSDRSGARC
jgi:hypothetical protein